MNAHIKSNVKNGRRNILRGGENTRRYALLATKNLLLAVIIKNSVLKSVNPNIKNENILISEFLFIGKSLIETTLDVNTVGEIQRNMA